MVSVPRLFTIVLGDERVAETVFSLKLSGELATITRNAFPSSRAIPSLELRRLTSEVAMEAMRKLLPSSQIAKLEKLKPEEALEFTPLGYTQNTERTHGTEGSQAQPLHISLSSVPSVSQTWLGSPLMKPPTSGMCFNSYKRLLFATYALCH